MRVGFLDNVRSRLKGDDEEGEFERAFRNPGWPEGVDDFEPMSNTGSFLPATYDVDPLADASLPGNAYTGASRGYADNQGGAGSYDQGVSDSVVRGQAAEPYEGAGYDAAPQDADMPSGTCGTPGYLQGTRPTTAYQNVIAFPGATLPAETGTMEPATTYGGAAQQPHYDADDEGVHVVARQPGERTAHSEVAHEPQKPFADRLRERVAAANVAGQSDDTLGRSRATLDAAATPAATPARTVPRRNENASSADIDAELEERRRARRARSTGEPHGEAEHGEEPGKRAASAPAVRPLGEAPADAPRPIPISCLVVRPRSYDNVSEIARGLIGEHRPVVMVLRGCSNELARRVVDFSFGLCCASGAEMRDFGNHVYGVLPRNTTFTEEDAMALRRQGIILRG